MDPTRTGRIVPAPDRSRIYSLDEDKALAENLEGIVADVRRGHYDDAPPNQDLLAHLHRRLFEGVRGHAGRIRREGFGSETLTFGPNRSLRRSEVPQALDDVFQKALPLINALENDPSQPQFEAKSIQITLWLHAEVIRIHPFEDGNGRTSRAFLNVLLHRLGMPPITFDVPKQEYRDCLNRYYSTADMQPLFDLALRCL